MPKIVTKLPGPKAKAWLKKSGQYEPNSMSDQVPLVWDKAAGCEIQDVDGNIFLDFCSGVLVTNVGHWGTGDLELTLRTMEDLQRAMPLFLKAYERS